MIATSRDKGVQTAVVDMPKPCGRCGGLIQSGAQYRYWIRRTGEAVGRHKEHYPACPAVPVPTEDRTRAYVRTVPHYLRANGEDAMVQGWEARREGVAIEANPRKLRLALHWAMGWLAADEDMAAANGRVLRRAE